MPRQGHREPQSFFVAQGDAFLATRLTRGPWSDALMHGGPPAALLGRAIEAVLPQGFRIARVTVEFLRPLTIRSYARRAEVTRAGRTVQRAHARLTADGQEVVAATAVAIRTAALAGVARPPGQPPRSVADSEPFAFPFFPDAPGYHTGMEARIARGTFGRGAAAVWMRMRHPLLPGETPSPLQRVLIAADSGNGVSAVLDHARYTFINPDLTVYLHRPPEGEWVCLDAATTPQPDGIGLADTALHDEAGPIGRSTQSLILIERP